MAEMEENKHGVFKQDLMRTFRQLKESRAAERHRLDNYKLMYNLKYNLVVTHTDVIVDSGRFDYMG